MNYSRRQLYALGEPLGDSVTRKKAGGGMIYGGGGGPSPAPASTAPTQTTVQNTNIPDYAQPYVETMLGATQQQLFNTNTDANGNVQITGIKPYQPYSTNPSDYVAGFSPLQQQAQQGIANLQVPGQYNSATGAAATGTVQALGAGQNLQSQLTNPNAMSQYMNPYLQNTLAPSMQLLNQQYGQQAAQEQGAATGAGAFGGSREALQQGLNQQNQMLIAKPIKTLKVKQLMWLILDYRAHKQEFKVLVSSPTLAVNNLAHSKTYYKHKLQPAQLNRLNNNKSSTKLFKTMLWHNSIHNNSLHL